MKYFFIGVLCVIFSNCFCFANTVTTERCLSDQYPNGQSLYPCECFDEFQCHCIDVGYQFTKMNSCSSFSETQFWFCDDQVYAEVCGYEWECSTNYNIAAIVTFILVIPSCATCPACIGVFTPAAGLCWPSCVACVACYATLFNTTECTFIESCDEVPGSRITFGGNCDCWDEPY